MFEVAFFMKISTKGRYALRLMLDLALHNTGEYISIKSIAKRQDISEKYLEQIIPQLVRAGYVKSARGAGGGYMLKQPPAFYTAGMILRLTEGSLAPVACVEDLSQCPRGELCAVADVYQKIYEAVNNVVDNITLEDLVKKQKGQCADNYMI